MRRIGSLMVGLGLVLGACGGGTGSSPTTIGAGTAEATVATTIVGAPTTTQPSMTTTTAPATTTTAPATTTTVGIETTTTATTPPATSPQSLEVAAYFMIDEPGRPGRQGPFLVPMSRTVPYTKSVARAALDLLLAGPSSGETAGVPSITTTIPAGVEVLDLDIGDGVATVDLSAAFAADEATAAASQRVAQVVFTLARFPTVDMVDFRQDGIDVEVQTSDGQLVSRPVGIDDYLDFAAALFVEEPAYGASGDSPLRVLGFGAVFEASFNYALTDGDGLIIAEGIAMTENGMGWGGFDFTIPYEVDRAQTGALILWANSAEDGSRIDVREYPVRLSP